MAQLSLSVCTLSRSTLIGPSCGSTAPSATPITSNLPERDTREIQFHSHPKQMRRTDLQHFTVHLLKLHKWMNYIKILQWTCETDSCDTGERKPVWARFTDWDMGADCTSGLGLGQQLNDEPFPHNYFSSNISRDSFGPTKYLKYFCCKFTDFHNASHLHTFYR